MEANNDEPLPEHSQAKVKLLGLYLDRYLNIISNLPYINGIKIFDLFCGEGLYSNGAHGSPLIILKALKDLYLNRGTRTGPPQIDCNFNDIVPQKIEKLRNVVAEEELHKPFYGPLSYSTTDYTTKVVEVISIIEKLGQEKAFIFIDPYGYKHIKATQIKALLASKKSEVLMWLPIQFMYRFNEELPVKDFIAELIPIDEWKQCQSPYEFIEKLTDAFRNFLGNDFFVDTFRIQKDASTVFSLFFFSSHIRGFEKMLEAKWEMDRKSGMQWTFKRDQPTLFDALDPHPFENILENYLRASPKTNLEIYKFTLHAGFLPKHAVEVLTSWQKSRILEVLENEIPLKKAGTFYINYDHFKKGQSLGNKIVTFKII
ncbi:MAG TPA: three-Cys-motif partner protein TcmP [Puia sp.]|jgi:three-Cys-motif partner protein|nr:three-Cys-motif partner protein TcmP [Puia sp.]